MSDYKKLLGYVKSNRMDLQNANCSIFPADFVFQAYVESDPITGVVYEPIFGYHPHPETFFQIIPDEKIRELAKTVYQRSMANEKYFKKIYSETLRLEKETDLIWKENISLEELSDTQLLDLFNRIAKNGEEWWKYTVIGEDKGRIIEEEIAPLFEKTYSMDKTDALQAIALLSHPKNEAIFTGERNLLHKIALILGKQKEKQTLKNASLLLKKNKKLNSLVNKYAKDYFYSKSSFLDRVIVNPPTIIAEALKEIESKSVDSIKLDLDKLQSEKKSIKLKQKALLKKLNPSKELKKNIEFATILTEWLDYRKRGMMKSFYYLLSIMHETAKRKNIPYVGLCTLTAEEFRGILSGKKVFDPIESEKREQNSLTVHEKGQKTRIFYDDEAKSIFDASKEFISKMQYVKGAVASLGMGEKVFSGKVRIIMDPSKEQFNEGEILVTSMTRIEFVPLMRKAKAIITDEGGIGCHAAIVSRELGIPCIIGTKNATKLLKNGQEVEMDLKSGEVKGF